MAGESGLTTENTVAGKGQVDPGCLARILRRMTAALNPLSSKARKLSPRTVDKRLLRELNERADDLRSGKVKGLTTKEAYGFSL
jgi:hypothetical protein